MLRYVFLEEILDAVLSAIDQCGIFFPIPSLNNPLLAPQIDVFNAFIDLLRQTGNVTKGSGGLSNPSRSVLSCALCSFCCYLKCL